MLKNVGFHLPRGSSNNLAVAKAMGCSPQIDSKDPLLKTATIQLIEHGEADLLSTQNIHLYASIFGKERYSTLYQKRNINTKAATKPLIYDGVMSARYARAMVTQNLCSDKPVSEST